MMCEHCGGTGLHATSAGFSGLKCGFCRGTGEVDDDGEPPVFTNCNVCGRKLHTAAEDEMGMCEMCARQ